MEQKISKKKMYYVVAKMISVAFDCAEVLRRQIGPAGGFIPRILQHCSSERYGVGMHPIRANSS